MIVGSGRRDRNVDRTKALRATSDEGAPAEFGRDDYETW
jgi:hypothetical protein